MAVAAVARLNEPKRRRGRDVREAGELADRVPRRARRVPRHPGHRAARPRPFRDSIRLARWRGQRQPRRSFCKGIPGRDAEPGGGRTTDLRQEANLADY